jgi:hypothetical protein
VAVGDRDTAGDRDRLQHPAIVGDQEERTLLGLEGAALDVLTDLDGCRW